jgi:hypothetical protein
LLAVAVVAAGCALFVGYLAGVRLGPVSGRWCPGCGRSRECLICDHGLVPERRKHGGERTDRRADGAED